MSDVMVIGGGIVGRSIAWLLSDAGASVDWIAPAALSGTASGASGAMLSVASEVSAHRGADEQLAELGYRRDGRRRWDEWLPRLTEETGIDPHLVRGTFVVGNAIGDDDAAELAAIRAAAAAIGGCAETVRADDVPGLRPDRQARAFDAVHLADEATIDVGRVLAALEVVIERDARTRTIAETVVRIEVDGDRVVAHAASGARVESAHAVLATGATTPDLLAASGLDELLPPVFGGRGVSLVVREAAPLPTCVRTPNRAFACGLHVVPRADGLTYIGATNRLSTGPEADRRPTLEEVGTVLRGAIRELSGALRHAELVDTAIGHRPVTVDRMPLVGRTSAPRVLAATGTWRTGVVLAPVVAELIADELSSPGATAGHPFAPTRALPEPGLDPDALRRGARGILTGLIGGGVIEPGRAAEAESFLEAALASLTGHADERHHRSLARLLQRAPLEEVLPLIFDAAGRQRM